MQIRGEMRISRCANACVRHGGETGLGFSGGGRQRPRARRLGALFSLPVYTLISVFSAQEGLKIGSIRLCSDFFIIVIIHPFIHFPYLPVRIRVAGISRYRKGRSIIEAHSLERCSDWKHGLRRLFFHVPVCRPIRHCANYLACICLIVSQCAKIVMKRNKFTS